MQQIHAAGNDSGGVERGNRPGAHAERARHRHRHDERRRDDDLDEHMIRLFHGGERVFALFHRDKGLVLFQLHHGDDALFQTELVDALGDRLGGGLEFQKIKCRHGRARRGGEERNAQPKPPGNARKPERQRGDDKDGKPDDQSADHRFEDALFDDAGTVFLKQTAVLFCHLSFLLLIFFRPATDGRRNFLLL